VAKHPMQPIEPDAHGVMRFKANAIVRHLLETHPTESMNTIALGRFSREDREQFAQLIGYSVSGAGDLSYVSRELIEAADAEVARWLAEVPPRG
jgi:hypothetical protein